MGCPRKLQTRLRELTLLTRSPNHYPRPGSTGKYNERLWEETSLSSPAEGPRGTPGHWTMTGLGPRGRLGDRHRRAPAHPGLKQTPKEPTPSPDKERDQAAVRRVSSAAVKEAASTGPATRVPAPRNVFSVAVVEISTSALNLLSGTIQAPIICLCTCTHTWACVHMCVTDIMGICKPKQGLDDLQAFGLNTRERQPSFSSVSWNQRSGCPSAHSGRSSSGKLPRAGPWGGCPLWAPTALHVLRGGVLHAGFYGRMTQTTSMYRHCQSFPSAINRKELPAHVTRAVARTHEGVGPVSCRPR